jgi:hypothetical protein
MSGSGYNKNGVDILNGISGGSTIPVGCVNAYLGTSDPDGWVIANGNPRVNNDEKYNNLINSNIGNGTIRYVKIEFYSRFDAPGLADWDSLTVGKFKLYDNNNSQITTTPTLSGSGTYPTGPYYSSYMFDSTPSSNNHKTAFKLASSDVYNFNNPPFSVIADYGTSIQISGYELYGVTDNTLSSLELQTQLRHSNPKTWKVYVSNDNSKWVIFDEATISSPPENTTTPLKSVRNTPISIYSPPNYCGAFLRGTGSQGVYSGPANVNISQNHATQTHNHTASQSEHAHYTRHYIGTENSGFDPNFFDFDHDNFNTYSYSNGRAGNIANNTVRPLTGARSGATENTTPAVTVANSTTSVDANETRPFNYGVNWIIKL